MTKTPMNNQIGSKIQLKNFEGITQKLHQSVLNETIPPQKDSQGMTNNFQQSILNKPIHPQKNISKMPYKYQSRLNDPNLISLKGKIKNQIIGQTQQIMI